MIYWRLLYSLALFCLDVTPAFMSYCRAERVATIALRMVMWTYGKHTIVTIHDMSDLAPIKYSLSRIGIGVLLDRNINDNDSLNMLIVSAIRILYRPECEPRAHRERYHSVEWIAPHWLVVSFRTTRCRPCVARGFYWYIAMSQIFAFLLILTQG